jgi:hypothetical protein
MSQLRYVKDKIFDDNEELLIKNHYDLIKDPKSGNISIDKFSRCIFLNLPIHRENILNFLSQYYTFKFGPMFKNITLEQIKEMDLSDYFTIIFILTKANESSDDPYYKKNSFYILYDIIKGKVGSFEENILDFDICRLIFDFSVRVYINRHADREQIMNNLDEDKLLGFVKRNILNETSKDKTYYEDDMIPVEKANLDNFLKKLPNFYSFLKNYFHLRCMGIEYDVQVMSSLPVLHESGGAMTTELFFFFLLANPQIYFNKFGFKLFDSKKDGTSIASCINSFMGFSNPIVLFLHHWEKEENKEYILGAFISGKVRESAENFSGDENSFIFSLLPKLEIYKFQDHPDKVAFFLSKDIPPYVKSPGIGLGEWNKDAQEHFRLWLDAKDTHKSYLLKFDHVFEDGSPFLETQKFLNIMSIEVFGFGTEDNLNELRKKLGKDKIFYEKMKRVDKKQLSDSDFDKDVFFSETFSHQQYGQKSSLEN